MLDVLARHPNEVGNPINLIPLFGAGEYAGATQVVRRGVVCIFRVDVSLVFLGLCCDPRFPAATEFSTVDSIGRQRPHRARNS
jgi:hypothetical protein